MYGCPSSQAVVQVYYHNPMLWGGRGGCGRFVVVCGCVSDCSANGE